MPKRSDIEAQIAALTEQLGQADEDDDYEVWVKNDKGHETRLPSKKAGSWLKENFGIDLHPAPAGDGDSGDQGDGDSDAKTDKQPSKGYFGNRKTSS